MHRDENLESDYPVLPYPEVKDTIILQNSENYSSNNSITIPQTGMYTIQDFCWPRIFRSYVWDVKVTGAVV